MFGNTNLLSSDQSSPPFGSKMFSQDSQQQDDFDFNRSFSNKKQPSNFGLIKDMSFSKNLEEENDQNGSGYFKRGNNEISIDEGQNQDTLFNMFSQSKPSLLNNNSSLDNLQQQRQKTLSFQANGTDSFGSGFNYANESNIVPAQPKRNVKTKSSFTQKDNGSEDDLKQSPRVLSPTYQNMLKRSLEYLTPNIIDQGLKQLRQMNETRQTKPLASPSVIFNHCIDEEEIVQNIRGLARELKNIGQMEKDLEVELREKLEFLWLINKKDKEMIVFQKKRNNAIFDKLFKDAQEKMQKKAHLQIQMEREVEVMQNLSAVNKKSEQILQEKRNYVKIQDRVETILQKKQMKVDQAQFLKKIEENSYMKKTSNYNKGQVNHNLQQNIQNTALDYSQSTENNGSNNFNAQRYSEKSFTLSQLEFNPNNQQSNNHKGYTKKQLEEFLQRNERKQQSAHEQILEKKLQKEQQEMSSATFHPKINKKSEQLTQSTWEPIEERIERMQEKMIEKRKKQCENEYTKYTYSPLINRKSSQLANKLNRTPLNKSYNNLNRSTSPFNKSINQTQDLSTSRFLNSSRKNNENISQISRPLSSQTKSKNQSTTSFGTSKNFQKNDSEYNIQSYKEKKNQMNKQGQASSSIKISQFGGNENTPFKTETINFNDLQKEDYLLNFTQQYMLNKDVNQKLYTQGSIQSTLSKNSSNILIQENTSAKQQDLAKSPNLSASQQLTQRSRSSISINKMNEPKSPNLINKKSSNQNQNAKVIPLNKDNKFILNLMNKKK